MHKKMMALCARCAARAGDAPAVRRAIGRAQCNDAYWHGVFGGLYLPHLRDAIWRNLAEAEAALRQGEGIEWDVLDLDGDGHDEIWVHSAAFSALVSPRAGRRDRGVHRVRGGDELREHAHPPPRGLSRPRARAAAEQADEATAARRASTTSRRPCGSRLAPRSTRTTARCSWTGCCREGVGPEEYAAAVLGDSLLGARALRPPVERRKGGVEIVCRLGEGKGRPGEAAALRGGRPLMVSWQWDTGVAEPAISSHRALAGQEGLARGQTPRAGRMALRHRDRRQVGAGLRPHPPGRIGHVPLAGGARRRSVTLTPPGAA